MKYLFSVHELLQQIITLKNAYPTELCKLVLHALTSCWIWIKPFLLLSPRWFHLPITHCEAPPFHIISIPAGNYCCNYQMLQIRSDI